MILPHLHLRTKSGRFGPAAETLVKFGCNAGWLRLDPVVALVVAANIVWTGIGIIRRTAAGLMDAALGPGDQAALRDVLRSFETQGTEFAALQTRQSGAHKFVSLIVRVPGEWTTRQSHELLEQVESAIRRALPGASVLTHLEPLPVVNSLTQADPDQSADAKGDSHSHRTKQNHAQA
jgi:divalent metal cation (Fe/Co/Zn/Cd) transporter